MSIEKVSDFLNNSPHSQTLMRIYLAHKLEKYIRDEFDEQTKVVLRSDEYVINCANAHQAQFLKVRLRQIQAQISAGAKVVFKI